MAKPRSDFIDRIQYCGLRVVCCCLHCWPVSACLRVAKLLGDVMYTIDRRHYRRAMGNLKRSFPDKSHAELQQLTRRSMQQLFMLFVETLFTTRLIRLDTIAKHIRLENMGEALKLLMKRQQGMIVLTGHYGNWEILGYALATLGFETVSVARPLDNPYVNKYLLGVRERQGQRIIAKKGATPIVVETLDRNGVVGFIADQNAGSKGLFVDFFGRKASTYKSIGLLAMQYKVPVVIGCARRLSDKFEFELLVQDIIWPADWENRDDALIYITQRYTKAIEDFVTGDPGQYLWIHRRWKTRPKGETPEQFD